MILFHYISKDSAIHRLSPLTKLIAMLIIAFSSITLKDITLDWLSFTLLYSLLFLLFYQAKISLIQAFRDFRYFMIAIPLIIFFSAFNFQSNPNLYLHHFSIPALLFSSTFILKLYLFSLISILFIATTTVREINYAIETLLRKVPFVNSVRIATMINLCIVQIPIIFDLYQQIKVAQKSRCLDNRRNPIRKVIIILNILIHKVLLNADSIALNYEAKAFSEKRSSYKISIPPKEIFYLSTFSTSCLIISFLKSPF